MQVSPSLLYRPFCWTATLAFVESIEATRALAKAGAFAVANAASETATASSITNRNNRLVDLVLVMADS
jgi:hypothetical protein